MLTALHCRCCGVASTNGGCVRLGVLTTVMAGRRRSVLARLPWASARRRRLGEVGLPCGSPGHPHEKSHEPGSPRAGGSAGEPLHEVLAARGRPGPSVNSPDETRRAERASRLPPRRRRNRPGDASPGPVDRTRGESSLNQLEIVESSRTTTRGYRPGVVRASAPSVGGRCAGSASPVSRVVAGRVPLGTHS